MDILGNIPGFPGFFVAGVFSGALSTVSGGLNSLTFLVQNIPGLVQAWLGIF